MIFKTSHKIAQGSIIILIFKYVFFSFQVVWGKHASPQIETESSNYRTAQTPLSLIFQILKASYK